jgi:hypothetical protein
VERIPLPYWRPAPGNNGLEGICHAAGRIIAAAEFVEQDGGHRYAPVFRHDGGEAGWTRFRLRLTTPDGLLSALTCRPEGDRIAVLAIERYFQVSRLIRFSLPLEGPAGDVVPVVALDLAPFFLIVPNLEGLAPLPDGRLVIIIDNSYGGITGPNEVIVLEPGLLRARSGSRSGSRLRRR